MSSEQKTVFTKENLNTYLKALAKEYRRLNGKTIPAELVLIGGASVLINYGFRGMTTDIDGIIQAASSMKDAINRVGDQFGLPNGWLNSDFSQTGSYTPKLLEYSVYYKTFSNILTIRTVSAEYLIAMKLRSGRQYKNDLSDVLGILAEHEKAGKPITMEQIKRAVDELYGSWSALPKNAADFIENAMNDGRFEALYTEVSEEEKATKTALIGFDQEYPGVTNESNVNDIIQGLRNRRGKKKTDNIEK